MYNRLPLSLAACLFLLAALTFAPHVEAGDSEFLTVAAPLARQSQRETGVPASVTLAQAVWETGRGASSIGQANNYFGIKAAGVSDDLVNIGAFANGWVWAWTKEWDGKRYVPRRERFRTYRSMEDSFRDHGVLLATTPRYAAAMASVDDPREFARRIAAAGYATSPTYGADLIALMDAENLYRFDLPRNDAEFLGQSDYITVRPGEIFQIYFDVKNMGFGTWSPAAGYGLASANDTRFGAAARQELGELVIPGRVKRWALTMVAPRDPGTFRTAWQMSHGAVRFGPEMFIQVTVSAPQAEPPWVGAVVTAVVTLLAVAGGWFGWRRRQKNLAFH